MQQFRHFALPWTLLVLTSACSTDLNLGDYQPTLEQPELQVECSTEIATTDGRVIGKQLGSDTCAYLGIPFAAPPLGENRFRPPQPVEPYGLLEARSYRPDCTQIYPLEDLAPAGGSEDCLHLNIWRPAVDRGEGVENLPVMVFIYGGAFLLGGGSWFLYEGTDLARHGAIVVTINYRLGPMGYLAMPALADDNDLGANGSFGTLDQIAALEWVNANIRDFGGDPDNVTVFGESAGAISTCQMIGSPMADGLFQRAIMQSGNCVAGEIEQSYPASVSFAAAAGCPVSGTEALDCLRDLPPEDIWSAVSTDTSFAFWPHADGVVLPDQPINQINAGSANKVDLMAGYNDDEMTIVQVLPVFSNARNMGWDGFWQLVADEFGISQSEKIRSVYDETQFENPVQLWFDVLEDMIFTCSSMDAVETLSAANDTYMYNFSVDPGAYSVEDQAGSFHSLELSFVFGNYEFLQLLFHDDDSAQRIIAHSERIQRYWTRFARTGDPNGGDDPFWEKFSTSQSTLGLNETPRMLPQFKRDTCDYWNDVLPRNNDDLFAYMARLEFYDTDKISVEIPF